MSATDSADGGKPRKKFLLQRSNNGGRTEAEHCTQSGKQLLEHGAATVRSSASTYLIPSKRNKRKMREPKKRRTDFSIRSLCSNSDDEEVEENEDGEEEEEEVELEEGSPVRVRSCREKEKSKEDKMTRRDLKEEGKKDEREDEEEEEEDGKLVSQMEDVHRQSATGPSTSSTSDLSLAQGYSPYPPLNLTLVYPHQQQQQQRPCTVVSGNSRTPSLLSPVSLSSTDGGSVFASNDRHHHHPSSGNSYSTASVVAPIPPITLTRSSATSVSPSSPTSGLEDCPSAEGSHQTGLSLLSRRPRKNYKNMTKQRRIEANARERTRVHTISAAFESLRRAVPSYSYNQRLSKLAILRIACSYILALARLAELDYSQEQNGMTFGDCVDLCTETIQAEGKAKRRH